MADQVVVHGPGEATATVPAGTTAREALKALDAIRGQVLVARLDGDIKDLGEPVVDGQRIEPVYADSDEGRRVLRHSVAHIMAQAVTDLFPGAKFAIGPPIEDGFYYDFDVPEPFTPEDLERITDRMHEIIREDQPFQRRDLDRDDALKEFADQPYKTEIVSPSGNSEIRSSLSGSSAKRRLASSRVTTSRTNG